MGEAKRKHESAAHAPRPDPASSALVAGLLAGKGVPFTDATKDAPKPTAKAETLAARFERLKLAAEAAYREMVEKESPDERIGRLMTENKRLSHVAMLLERRANELEITVRSQASLIGPPQYQEQPQQAPIVQTAPVEEEKPAN